MVVKIIKYCAIVIDFAVNMIPQVLYKSLAVDHILKKKTHDKTKRSMAILAVRTEAEHCAMQARIMIGFASETTQT